MLTGAIATEIRLDDAGGAVASLDVRTRANEPVAVSAGQFVLAGGGMEIVRLLLASRSRHANGVGNAHDVVGRYYMSHIAGTIGLFRPRGVVFNGYDVADDGAYCRRRLALRPDAQRRHRIANVIARLHHPDIADPAHGSGVLSALRLGRAAIPHQFRHRLRVAGDDDAGTLARHAANVARDAPEVARFAARMLFGRRLAARKFPSVVVRVPGGRYALDVHAEQEPNRDSRVTLADGRDRFGVPRLRVDWRFSRGDIASVATALALLRDDLAAQGCGTLDYDPAIVEHEMTRYGSYTGHHLGLARMGDDPRTSVVDGDCRVHALRNLHIAGTAVFATSSQANPTLTAVALGIRLADRIAALTETRAAEVA